MLKLVSGIREKSAEAEVLKPAVPKAQVSVETGLPSRSKQENPISGTQVSELKREGNISDEFHLGSTMTSMKDEPAGIYDERKVLPSNRYIG